jgi:hypothetical protein
MPDMRQHEHEPGAILIGVPAAVAVGPPPAPLGRCQICGAPHGFDEPILCRGCGEPVLLWGWAP